MENKLSGLQNIDIEVYEYDPYVKDDLFLKFYQKVHKFNLEEYKKNLNLKTNAATHLKNAIDNNQIASMLSIQEIPKIGIKSLENIHNFLSNDKKIMTQSELDLF